MVGTVGGRRPRRAAVKARLALVSSRRPYPNFSPPLDAQRHRLVAENEGKRYQLTDVTVWPDRGAERALSRLSRDLASGSLATPAASDGADGVVGDG